ncbi:hypothetical protein ARALYDRAFT_911186 [Arabidopsis lyrata subsp. lyrata]|uniref:Uncharacterized protein n=1 Tax=Arabidopsis lyrata subsp. lyrata TaxID=81972 RepID=D7LX79_ARALL|nr:defensin-like protein 155 [Arabidopsis lyrata subsp. lyrata]EFH48693.1 hypothetical protein ARALYDRAFT_911186 [Arabidopsis lyrata subsp. lyrata]|eukprot:XP_002872434.1 defensin-like protein 155 [Arabidopsis lyrata subsp. lyrata]
MTKISCSYFLILMLVLLGFSIVESKGDRRCTLIIDLAPCHHVHCRLNCYAERNGVGECIASKVGSTPNCVCTYDC